jgi:hypothetical protein
MCQAREGPAGGDPRPCEVPPPVNQVLQVQRAQLARNVTRDARLGRTRQFDVRSSERFETFPGLAPDSHPRYPESPNYDEEITVKTFRFWTLPSVIVAVLGLVVVAPLGWFLLTYGTLRPCEALKSEMKSIATATTAKMTLDSKNPFSALGMAFGAMMINPMVDGVVNKMSTEQCIKGLFKMDEIQTKLNASLK